MGCCVLVGGSSGPNVLAAARHTSIRQTVSDLLLNVISVVLWMWVKVFSELIQENDRSVQSLFYCWFFVFCCCRVDSVNTKIVIVSY